jgi:hypothetical protein
VRALGRCRGALFYQASVNIRACVLVAIVGHVVAVFDDGCVWTVGALHRFWDLWLDHPAPGKVSLADHQRFFRFEKSGLPAVSKSLILLVEATPGIEPG